MTLNAEQVKQLTADLDPRRVAKREGTGGKALSYLKTHDVKRTANRIFGYDGWHYTVDELQHLGTETFKNSKGREGIRVAYRATVTLTAAGARRGDTGYGDAIEYTGSILTPHELASKEAVSDALKRCLSSWGDQFGLVLYGADPAPPVDEASEDPGSASPTARGRQQQPRPTAPATPSRDTKLPGTIWLPPPGGEPDMRPIDNDQRRRMFGIAKGRGLDEDAVRAILKKGTGSASTAGLPQWQYDRLIQEIELNPKVAA